MNLKSFLDEELFSVSFWAVSCFFGGWACAAGGCRWAGAASCIYRIHFLTGCTARGKALVGSAWIEIRLEAGRERLPCTTECWWWTKASAGRLATSPCYWACSPLLGTPPRSTFEEEDWTSSNCLNWRRYRYWALGYYLLQNAPHLNPNPTRPYLGLISHFLTWGTRQKWSAMPQVRSGELGPWHLESWGEQFQQCTTGVGS